MPERNGRMSKIIPCKPPVRQVRLDIRGLSYAQSRSWMLILPSKNVVHEVAGVHVGRRQRPVKAFGTGQLDRGSAAEWVVPQLDEAADGPTAAAESLNARPGIIFGPGGVGKQFGPVGQPFDEHSGFDVP